MVPGPAGREPPEGVFGVIGNELAEFGRDVCLIALAMGKKMPVPSIDVVKYDTLINI